MKKAFYFGCDNTSGHSLYDSRMTTTHPNKNGAPPFTYAQLDTGFLKAQDVPDAPGNACVTRSEGWSILSVWDRSVDSRGGSHSEFILQGTFKMKDLEDEVRKIFPKIWDRFNFELKYIAADTLPGGDLIAKAESDAEIYGHGFIREKNGIQEYIPFHEIRMIMKVTP